MRANRAACARRAQALPNRDSSDGGGHPGQRSDTEFSDVDSQSDLDSFIDHGDAGLLEDESEEEWHTDDEGIVEHLDPSEGEGPEVEDLFADPMPDLDDASGSFFGERRL